jgi:hypothetical protein
MTGQIMALSSPAGVRAILQQQIPGSSGASLIVANSRRTQPLWFDGRFLAARDLERDQNYFLRREADLGRAAGFGVIHGLLVERVSTGGQAPDAETFVIRAGQGITPGGSLVMIPSDLTVRISDLAQEESLDVQFGISSTPAPVARTRTGLYIIALRPVQFTANPITAYPTSIQGSSVRQDGDIVEATAVSLVSYPVPSNNFDATTENAAVARQIFVAGNVGQASNSLLPLAIISIDRGAIQWLDPYMVRRDSGPEFSGLRFGLPDPAAQQAFLLQYNSQLQLTVNSFIQTGAPPRFAATDYFQALPSGGPFPLASINIDNSTQLFFPQQTNVRLSVVPEDELPAVVNDSMSLPPIDLTLPASAYADLTVLALVPVPRQGFATLTASLPPMDLAAAVPPALSYRKPIDLLRFFHVGALAGAPPSVAWQNAIGTQVYGYYIRCRSSPVFTTPASATATTTTTLAASPIAGFLGLTLTATVSPSGATGTVTFSDGANALATVNLTAGTATLVWPSLGAGAHALTAVYNGDANFAASTSPVLNETVGGT